MSAIELFSSDRWLVRAVNVDGEQVLKSYAGKGVSQRFAAQARPIIHIDTATNAWHQARNAA